MLEIVQAGQADKADLLLDMHRLRARVFGERMKWDVNVDSRGLEVDQFDIPNAVYLLALDNERNVIGNWRLLPTSGPTMIRDVWPQFINSLPMPSDPYVWEASRFAVHSPRTNSDENTAQINRATQEMFCGLTELSMMCGIRQVFTLYDMRIKRLLRRLDCNPAEVSERLPIDGNQTEIGCFNTNADMLARLQAATGIEGPVVTPDMLPPILEDYYAQNLRGTHGQGVSSAGFTKEARALRC